MTRVAHILRRIVPGEWGGIETMVAAVGARQVAQGHQIRIFATSAMAQCGADEVVGLPVRRFRYRYPILGLTRAAQDRLDRLGGNPFSPALFRHLRRWRPDVIHCHTPGRLAANAVRAGRVLGAPVVLSLHGGLDAGTWPQAPVGETPRGALNWGRLMDPFLGVRRLFGNLDALLPVASDDVARLESLYPGRVFHLPNGVDPQSVTGGDGLSFRRLHGIPHDVPLLLVLARVVPQKNQRLAVLAHSRLLRRYPHAHLAIMGPVGDPDYARELQRTAAALGTRERLRFLAPTIHGSRAFRDALAAADILLLPSRHEPFGIAVLEAWAAGTPVVASQAGELSRLVRNRRFGLSIQENDPQQWAAAAAMLIEHPDLRRNIVKRARNEALQVYSWDAVVARLGDIYAKLSRVVQESGSAKPSFTEKTHRRGFRRFWRKMSRTSGLPS